MASVKVKFRPSTQEGKEGTIYYQIIRKRVIRQIKTDCRILADEWDETNGVVVIATDSNRISVIRSIKERINRDVKRLNTVINRLHGSGDEFTANNIVVGFHESVNVQ